MTKENTAYDRILLVVDDTKQKAISIKDGVDLITKESDRKKFAHKVTKPVKDLCRATNKNLCVYKYHVPIHKEYRTAEEQKLFYGEENYDELAHARYQFIKDNLNQ